MLINFKVKNFMSFKDLQELSMVTGKVRRKDERTYKYKNFSLLKFSTIFGANASGKSNFVNALNIMRSIIIEEMPTTIKQYYYNLDDESKFTNTYFETELLIKDKCYSYGFEVNFLNNEIVEEWLLELIGDKVDIIFERSLPKNYIEIKRKFSKEISQKLNVYIADAKRDRSLLFLSFLNTTKESLYETDEAIIFKDVYKWFLNDIQIIMPNDCYYEHILLYGKDKIDKIPSLLNTLELKLKT